MWSLLSALVVVAIVSLLPTESRGIRVGLIFTAFFGVLYVAGLIESAPFLPNLILAIFGIIIFVISFVRQKTRE
ncbi:hypothetical protein [Salimicrobium halophilum]|uniref:Uncharacterized protein n=1 Tax=Salimicrobium halophilum TaxID=86666 RepID=A0A1G8RBA0_9BACI|nr:hypothetical protein [Salimicrobium halophilum]SDJ14201.1 hypothetical protein SAMN04490247_0933 [Salimicrobium halophilum]